MGVVHTEEMVLNMGQWLSIPFVITGILILVWSSKQEPDVVIKAS